MISSQDSRCLTEATQTSNPAQLRARVIEQTRIEPSFTRSELRKRLRVVMAAVLFVPLLVFWASGGIRAAPRPEHVVAETALGSAVIALGAAAIALNRGRSMLGRSSPQLLVVALVVPVLLLAWKVCVSSLSPNMMLEWLDRPGLRCLGLSLVLALVPWLGLVWMRRGSDPTHPRQAAAAIGTAVGAGTWVLVDLWCPVGFVPHLLLGHLLPLVVTILASALIGGRLLMIRSDEARVHRCE